jgi:hypothetical protein
MPPGQPRRARCLANADESLPEGTTLSLSPVPGHTTARVCSLAAPSLPASPEVRRGEAIWDESGGPNSLPHPLSELC